MIHVVRGRWVLCIGVPAVTEKRRLQHRQVNLPGRVVMREARLMMPQSGQTGPSGQRAFSSHAKAFSSVSKRRCSAARVSGSRPDFKALASVRAA